MSNKRYVQTKRTTKASRK